MDPRAQGIINQVSLLSQQFGVLVTFTRIIQASTPVRNAFGTPQNAKTDTLTANVIIESLTMDQMPTLAGGKPKEELKLITNAGTFLNDDEIKYNGHTYKVNFTQPVPFTGANVVDFVHAFREVD